MNPCVKTSVDEVLAICDQELTTNSNITPQSISQNMQFYAFLVEQQKKRVKTKN